MEACTDTHASITQDRAVGAFCCQDHGSEEIRAAFLGTKYSDIPVSQ
jgi:hypothetical protein